MGGFGWCSEGGAGNGGGVSQSWGGRTGRGGITRPQGRDASDPRAPRCPPRRYMCSLSLFHYSEYLVTAINNPRSLSLDSFLLNHSFEYNLAALSSWVEFTLEKLLLPGQPQPRAVLPNTPAHVLGWCFWPRLSCCTANRNSLT